MHNSLLIDPLLSTKGFIRVYTLVISQKQISQRVERLSVREQIRLWMSLQD